MPVDIPGTVNEFQIRVEHTEKFLHPLVRKYNCLQGSITCTSERYYTPRGIAWQAYVVLILKV